MKKITLLFILLAVSFGYSQTEIAVNGGFETGDFTDWTQFPSGTQDVIMTNPSEGTYCAELNNTMPASASLIKNANVGIGSVSPSQEVTITFDARGTLAAGGVAFAEFFSEISGGGVSSSVLLGGAPLGLNADPAVWTSFSFTPTTGPDVSGGVTLQLTATTGGDGSSTANVFYDNVSITIGALPTCEDGVQNGQETGVDCGGPDCDACPPSCTDEIQNGDETGVDCGGSCPNACDPVVSADLPIQDPSGVLSVYSESYAARLAAPQAAVTNFNFNAFQGAGTISEVDLESNGNLTGKIENLSFYGAQWDAADVSAYTYVHIDYYATTSTNFNFYLIDATAGIGGGAAEEPRYRFGGGTPDIALVQGAWTSVFIPLSAFTSWPTGGFSYDLNDIFQWKFDGNGSLYFDNIYFTSSTLAVDEFEVVDYNVYPNPSNNVWNVKTKDQIINTVQVFDVLGKEVMNVKPNNTDVELNASVLPKGLYFAKITTDLGSNSIKLIKN